MEETPIIIPKKDPLAPLRFMEFRAYMGMRFFFTFAIQMQAVVIGFYIYQVTGDKLALGLIGLAEAVPAIGIALYGGYLADKSEKKGLLLKIYLSVLLCSSIIALLVFGLITNMGQDLMIILIYVMIFAMGMARGFLGPATFSIMGKVVPRELYPRAATWSSSTWQTATIIGALTGGISYGFYGIRVTYIIIVGLLGLALASAAFLKRHPATFIPTESISKSLKEGITFVFKNKMMLGAMSLDLFSVFFGGAVALLPVFANDILKVGPQGLGLMRAAVSLGSVLT
ncbi:MAG: MFS transporter, partial [Chitinophagaceae bacterium]